TIERHWLARGDFIHLESGGTMAEEALAAYEEALRLNPLLKEAWTGKAVVLLEQRQHEEVLEKALRRNPALKDPRTGEAYALIGPRLYEEALLASEEALQLDPAYFRAWKIKAHVLAGLKRYEESLQAYDEALQAYEKLLRENSTRSRFWYADTWHWKSKVLKTMGRKREANQAKKRARQHGYPF
ncbi:MAG TPA: tetratricopeptide repeat protein, partial [Ktedonobacterales bacterium]|nr:tetratricopeptide repeat protein [Ktedonobacterales bacterium]